MDCKDGRNTRELQAHVSPCDRVQQVGKKKFRDRFQKLAANNKPCLSVLAYRTLCPTSNHSASKPADSRSLMKLHAQCMGSKMAGEGGGWRKTHTWPSLSSIPKVIAPTVVLRIRFIRIKSTIIYAARPNRWFSGELFLWNAEQRATKQNKAKRKTLVVRTVSRRT